VIPAEAVEAAAKGLAAANLRFKPWDDLDDVARNHFMRDARAALEAAAPYMLAEAWEEGYTLGYADCANKQESNRPNPYMLNNEGEK
jgi:hypothetical protein